MPIPHLIAFQKHLFPQSSRFRFAALARGQLDLQADSHACGEVVEAAVAGRRADAVRALADYLQALVGAPWANV